MVDKYQDDQVKQTQDWTPNWSVIELNYVGQKLYPHVGLVGREAYDKGEKGLTRLRS